MLHDLIAIFGLGLACGLWVLFQRWVEKHDPGQPGVEGSVGCSHGACASDGGCDEPAGVCAGCSLKGQCGR